MTRYQPRSLAPLPMSTNHTLRPVIDELRESAAETASRYSLDYDPAVDAAARGLLSASCLSDAQLEALQARFASEYRPIADRALWDDADPHLDLPIGMIEPPDDTDPALAALAEVEAAARALAASIAPRRPTLLQRLLPTTATAFWMACALWLGFLLARAEGWL